MEIKQLKVFIKVCEKMSFTKAAKELNYAQSTVSDIISTLESELATKLFDRIGKRVYLTHKGEVLLDLGTKLISDYNALIKQFDESKNQIRIGIIETLCSYKFPDFFRLFLEKLDGVEIQFKILRCDEILDSLKTNQIDIAYTLDEYHEHNDFTTFVLTHEEIVFVSSTEEDKIDSKNLIIPEGEIGYLKLLWDYINSNDIKLGTVINIESIEGIKNYVKSGFGITFLPISTVEKELHNKELYTINVNDVFNHEIKIILLKEKHLSHPLSQLIEYSLNLY